MKIYFHIKEEAKEKIEKVFSNTVNQNNFVEIEDERLGAVLSGFPSVNSITIYEKDTLETVLDIPLEEVYAIYEIHSR